MVSFQVHMEHDGTQAPITGVHFTDQSKHWFDGRTSQILSPLLSLTSYGLAYHFRCSNLQVSHPQRLGVNLERHPHTHTFMRL